MCNDLLKFLDNFEFIDFFLWEIPSNYVFTVLDVLVWNIKVYLKDSVNVKDKDYILELLRDRQNIMQRIIFPTGMCSFRMTYCAKKAKNPTEC